MMISLPPLKMRSTKKHVACLIVLLALCSYGFVTLNGCGSGTELTYLDSAFGTAGVVTTDFSSRLDEAYAITLQSDGKIIVAGRSKASTWDFALARYNADGSIDTTFNTTGMVTTDFSSGEDIVRSLSIQTDGKIVAVGDTTTVTRSETKIALARYSTDGTLDTEFNTSGKITTSVGTAITKAYAVALQADGKIVVVGEAVINDNTDFAIVRYGTNGDLDGTFSDDGKITESFGTSTDGARAVAVQSDGKILVSGQTLNSDKYDFAIARYSSLGNLDTDFDTDGKVTTNLASYLPPYNAGDLNSDDYMNAMAVDISGGIFLAGYTVLETEPCFAVAHYKENGTLNSQWNSLGVVHTAFSGQYAYGQAVALKNNVPTVAGFITSSTQNDVAVVRYLSSGAADGGFGNSGIVTTDVDSAEDKAYAIAIQTDGKTLVAGTRISGVGSDFLLLRYQD